MTNNKIYTQIVTKDERYMWQTPTWHDNMEEAVAEADRFIKEWYPDDLDNYKVIEVDPKDYENAWWNDPAMIR